MIYNILDEMIKSRFLLNNQKKRLITIKKRLIQKEKKILKIN
jgi:hypothetical protein